MTVQEELKPILLRRMKEDVEKLPEKEEVVVWVELTQQQHAYYRALYSNQAGACTCAALTHLTGHPAGSRVLHPGAQRSVHAWPPRAHGRTIPDRLHTPVLLAQLAGQAGAAGPKCLLLQRPLPAEAAHARRSAPCWRARPTRTCPTCATWPWSCASCAATRCGPSAAGPDAVGGACCPGGMLSIVTQPCKLTAAVPAPRALLHPGIRSAPVVTQQHEP